MRRYFRGGAWAPLAVLTAFTFGACAAETADETGEMPIDDASEAVSSEPGAPPELGPADGRGMPGTELDRIAIGDMAPDFTLETYRGETLTLSENRGAREILLVFYRGAW